MSTFSAIVTCHEDVNGLRRMLGNLIYQTRKPDEIIVLASGLDAAEWGELTDDFAAHVDRVVACENRNDWGHEKRAAGIGLACKDYLGCFNHDDEYALDYIEKMMALAEAEDADVVYCQWNGIHDCWFASGSSTSGNYIVRREKALEAGYTDRHYEADGTFIERLKCLGCTVASIPDKMYFHNSKGVVDVP